MQITLPELGDGIASGDVLEIFVSVGDTITAGQDIIEMETDKATVPVPSKVGGKITKIVVSEGDTVPIGGVLIEIEASDASKKEAPQAEAPKAAAPKAEPPKAEAPKAEPPKPEPPKQSSPAPAPAKQEPPKPAPPKPAAPIAPATIEQPSSSAGVIPAGPAVRKLARETNVNLANVQGTGPGGRITSDDVLAAVRVATSKPAAAASGSATGSPRPARAGSTSELPGTADHDDYGPIRVERMSKIRKTIAAQMHASWSSVPRVTNFDDADISDLERLRQSSKDDYAAQGLKLTTMPFLIKAVATALRHHSSINAVIDSENEQIIYKDYVNIGIAVDTDRGLVVPVLRDVDRMGIPDITRALAETAGKVRGGQFAVSDLKGGSFTISNLGAIGGTYSTPIVNIPEVAILLVGRSRKLPVVMPDDTIQPRLMMPLSLSYDHRLVDGGTAARFLNDVISYLEAPSRLLLAL
jgi:pyruvate dehydrogenase E2 component (dihydrolipoamide acetyltransferase)